MAYELIKVEHNSVEARCYDLHIKNLETDEVMIADCVLIWENNQEELEEMFYAVKNGEW